MGIPLGKPLGTVLVLGTESLGCFGVAAREVWGSLPRGFWGRYPGGLGSLPGCSRFFLRRSRKGRWQRRRRNRFAFVSTGAWESPNSRKAESSGRNLRGAGQQNREQDSRGRAPTSSIPRDNPASLQMETEPEPEAEPEPHPEPGPAAPASPPCPAEGEDEDEDEDFQFLRCDGCGQDSAQPRLLRCLHTLCPGCLSDTKQCPRCQAATGAPAVDNLLFCNLRSRLQLWRQIRSSGGPGCSRCRAEAALVWCSDCEEFFCGRCLEEHQWWHKKKAHRVRRVEELRAGSARQFLEDTRGSCSLFCSSDSHPEESRVIYCPRCERALCCPCALLDTRHAPFRDLRAESRRRQDELRSLRRDLRRLRRSFEAALGRLRGEAARREEQRERLRERVRASAERLQELVRSEAEELRALLEARPEHGRSALAEELSGAEGALLRLEAAERLVERLGRYGGEQELMDMQPFVKAALLELRRLRPPEPPELREPPDFAECRARLRALVERVTGRPGERWAGPGWGGSSGLVSQAQCHRCHTCQCHRLSVPVSVSPEQRQPASRCARGTPGGGTALSQPAPLGDTARAATLPRSATSPAWGHPVPPAWDTECHLGTSKPGSGNPKSGWD
uniref:PML protein n=1 Tax=Junco hyemalis TaxID=40217 RepID=A0A8C5JGQ9_JUNHY